MSEKQTRQMSRLRFVMLAVMLVNIPLVIGLTIAYGLIPPARPMLIICILIDANLTAVFVAGLVIGSETMSYMSRYIVDYVTLKRSQTLTAEALETIKRDYDRFRALHDEPPLFGG